MSKIQLDLSQKICIKGEAVITEYKPSKLVEGALPTPPTPVYLTLRDVIAASIQNITAEKIKALTPVEKGQWGYLEQKICNVKDKVSVPTETVVKIKEFVLDWFVRPDFNYALAVMFDSFLGVTENFDQLGLEEVEESNLSVVQDGTSERPIEPPTE